MSVTEMGGPEGGRIREYDLASSDCTFFAVRVVDAKRFTHSGARETRLGRH